MIVATVVIVLLMLTFSAQDEGARNVPPGLCQKCAA